MKNIKKNQIIVYVIALMLVVAGYLNYTGTNNENRTITTSSTDNNIGDAQLVSSNIYESDDNIKEENVEENNIVETVTKIEEDDDEYFSKSKLERDVMYSQMIETYGNILNSSNSSEIQKQSATDEIKKINDTKNSIMICENLIKTKGFNDVIIFVNNDSISVILNKKELNKEEVAQIQNIVAREMKAELDSIHISSK